MMAAGWPARAGGAISALALVFSAWAGAPSHRAAEPRAEAKAKLEQVEQLLTDWDVAGARQALSELEKAAPPDLEPIRYFKGRIAFEEGRYGDAAQLFAGAGLPDKEASYLRLAKDTQKVTAGHRRIESEHFVFLYPPGKDEILAPYALETLEAQRKALQADLGYAPEGKIRVEVVNDAHELAKISTLTYEQIRTTGTIAICKFSKLMVTSPKAVLRGYDWQDTLAHEFTHLVVTQKSHNSVPIWLHEGLAKYLESRWRGAPGLAMSPSALALLGSRVAQHKLVPFEKMHPSIALLPTAEDAATAFAEVFFAVDLLYREHGDEGLRALLDALAGGKTDRQAISAATGKPFPAFESAWLGHVKKQRFPKELLPTEKVVLKDQAPGEAKKKASAKGREISFGEFAEIRELEAKRYAHLGELLRERSRLHAATEEYGKAYRLVGNKYEALSNKYALALLEQKQTEEAEKVLQSSLKLYPNSAATRVHLGRIYLARGELPKAKQAYLEALSSDPFDPEIHLALLRVHQELGEVPLAQRERKASAALTGRPEQQVDAIARAMVKQGDLADVTLPAPDAAPTPPAAPAPARGTPPPGPPRD